MSELSPSDPGAGDFDLPPSEAKRQIGLLRKEVRRLSGQIDRQSAQLKASLARNAELEAGLASTLAELDKILTSKAWRAVKVVRQAAGALKRALPHFRPPQAGGLPPTTEAATEPAPPPPEASGYERWVEAYDRLSGEDRRAIAARIQEFGYRPLISIVILDEGGADDESRLLEQTLASIRSQLYPAWEICLAKDMPPTGAFIALLEPGDLLPEQALFEVASEIKAHPEAEIIYTDEDKIDGQGRRYNPAFKPDFSIELQLGWHLTGRLTIYRRALLETIGVSPGAIHRGEEQVLAVRAAVSCGASRIRHIPAVLCHRLVPAGRSNEAATGRHLETAANLAAAARELAKVEVTAMPGHTGWHRVTWPLPNPLPRVSVIIPTRDRADLLGRCVGGVLHRTDYPNLEVIVIDNDSVDTATQSLFKMLQKDGRVRVIPIPGPFNYSALNNAGVCAATGEILVLLNNDVDVIESGWLKEMVSHAVRPDVGAVGPKLLYGDGRIQHAGIVLGVGEHNAGPGVAGHFGHSAEGDDTGYLGQFALTRELSAVTGACLALRRQVFEAVGGLNETALPIAFNDVDFCLRIRAQGFHIIWTPLAELYHLESASRGLAVTPAQVARAVQETDYMRARWGSILDNDPFYNPNFARKDHTFELVQPPRQRPWLRGGQLSGSAKARAAGEMIEQHP